MDLLPTTEQDQIVDAASAFLADACGLARFNGGAAVDDADLPPRLGELGWFALTLPESAGGAGLGLAEEALVHREFGRAIAPLATLGAALGARVAWAAGQVQLCEQIAAGATRVGLAVPAGTNAEDGDPLDGPLTLLDAGPATLFLAWNAAQAVLWVAGSPRAATTSIDPGVGLRAVSGAPKGAVARGPSIQVEAAVLLAAQLCGVAEAARDLAVRHATTRQQFGQPIGAFQAVKHPCADMAVACEAAGSLLKLAALSVADGRADAPFLAASAKLVATDAALANARACVQIHGGLGVTAECAAHLFVKRAHVLDAIGGNRRDQQRRILAA
ncbi:MAG TPA: acyl-CoA dehydrogenase family protein [Nevskiaceae bacterium]|nr:acyl-CoA dehydrogenase family protein [Nevskiaceae bacterium]